jgi:hypothetical protein
MKRYATHHFNHDALYRVDQRFAGTKQQLAAAGAVQNGRNNECTNQSL